MYPYGLNNGDSEFRFGDSYYYYYGHCLELKVDRFGFPFFSKRHYKLHVRMIPWYVNCTKEVSKMPHLLFENSSSSGPLWCLLFCLVFSNCVFSILSDRHPIIYWKSLHSQLSFIYPPRNRLLFSYGSQNYHSICPCGPPNTSHVLKFGKWAFSWHFKGWFPVSRNFYVRTCGKFTFAMRERSLVSMKLEPRSTSRLSLALFILPQLFYWRN